MIYGDAIVETNGIMTCLSVVFFSLINEKNALACTINALNSICIMNCFVLNELIEMI